MKEGRCEMVGGTGREEVPYGGRYPGEMSLSGRNQCGMLTIGLCALFKCLRGHVSRPAMELL